VSRIARAVAPGFPHHITQRGNRRLQTFFSDDDYLEYLSLVKQWYPHFGVQVWGYCLMPNHVHLIAVPPREEALARAIGEVHRRYTRYVNFRQEWRGHLWQGRFGSFAMDERYLLACIRYIEMNPVRARLVQHPVEWRWSSAREHLDGREDGIVNVAALHDIVGTDWASLLRQEVTDHEIATLRKHERTGRPLGDPVFVEKMEALLNRALKPHKRGPAPGTKR
jgi:putative transposase